VAKAYLEENRCGCFRIELCSLMSKWAAFLEGGAAPGGNVIELAERRG
jgi:hypothetical protein